MGDRGTSQFISGLRFFTLLVTIFFFLGGLSILIFGCWIFYYFRTFESEFFGTMMVIGVAFVFWSSMSFWCIYHGSPITMYLYGCFLICTLIITLAGVGYTSVYRKAIFTEMQGGLNISLITSSPPNINIEFAQKTMKCCGVSNYTDWVRLSPQRVVPMSCCIDPDNCVTANYNDIYRQGCYEVIMASINRNYIWICIISCSLLTIPILGTTAACYLGFKLEKDLNRQRMLEVR